MMLPPSSRHSNPVPTSLRAAFEADKAHALKHKRLNIERLAELLGTTAATLYKWLETDSMPVRALIGWQHLTGANNVVRFLASREASVVICIPVGRRIDAADINALQATLTHAVGALLDHQRGRSDRETTLGKIGTGLEHLAWHHANVDKSDQPELELMS
ncbi:MAG: hypothetical protein AMXMBFR6_11720 [Betaproteobacteria bacterium]